MPQNSGAVPTRESIFQEMLEFVPAVFYDLPVDLSGRGGYVSPQAVQMLEINPEPPDFFFEKLFNITADEDKERVIGEWEQAQVAGGSFSIESKIILSGGREVYTLNKGGFIYGSDGTPLRQSGMILDISARKRIENTLRAREERYRKITESMSDYVFTIRYDNGKVVETIHGGACQPITGYTPEDFVGNPNLWIEMVHENDRKVIADRANRMLRGEDVEQLTHRIMHKSGKVRWVHSTIVTHRDDTGNILFFDGVIRDVTEQKHAEEQSKQRCYVNEMLLDAIPFAAVLMQEDGEVLAANSAGLEMGFAPGVSWNAAWKEINPAYECSSLLEEAMRDGRRHLAEIYHNKHCYEATLVPHEPDLCLCTFYDITRRKQYEDTLKLDKLIFEAMMSNPLSAIFLLNSAGRFEAVNEAGAKLLDVSSAEVAGLSFYELFPHREAEIKCNAMREALARRSPARLNECIRGRDYDTMIIPVFNDVGEPVRIAVFSRDITERKRSGEQLVEAYQTLACIVEQSPNAIVSIDSKGNVQLWNPAAERILGWKAAEVYGKPLPIFGQNPPESIVALRRALMSGESVARVDIPAWQKDGQEIMILVSGGPLLDAEGKVYGAILIIET